MPDGWDPAAPITFQISSDNNAYRDLCHAQQSVTGEWVPYEVTVPSVVPNGILFLPPDAGSTLGWIKIRSGTRSQPVNQEADRTFAILFD